MRIVSQEAQKTQKEAVSADATAPYAAQESTEIEVHWHRVLNELPIQRVGVIKHIRGLKDEVRPSNTTMVSKSSTQFGLSNENSGLCYDSLRCINSAVCAFASPPASVATAGSVAIRAVTADVAAALAIAAQ